MMAQATRAFQSGNYVAARDIATRAAKTQLNNPQVLQFLGIAQAKAGDPSEGFRTLKRAMALAPSDPKLRLNAARAAIDAGAHTEVGTICYPLGNNPAAQQLLAEAARIAGQSNVAAEHLAKLARQNPENAQYLNNYGNALLDMGDVQQAVDFLTRATVLAPGEAKIWLNHGRALMHMQDIENARLSFSRALKLAPADPEVNLELGKALLRNGIYEEALSRFAEAARNGIQNVDVFLHIGLCFLSLERRSDAEQAYRMALHVDPQSTRATLNLAVLLEQENRIDELEALTMSATDSGMSGSDIDYCRALVLRREGRLSEALALAEKAEPDSLDEVIHAQFIGQVADRLGDSDKAFAAFRSMNAAMSQKPEALLFDGTEHCAFIGERTRAITSDWFKDWTIHTADDGQISPVFLGGFLRSGTTLLDTVLMAHPDTHVREEEAMLARLEEAAPPIADLPTLSSKRIETMRAAYFAELRNGGELPRNKMLIDKYPLMPVRAAFIHRVFPDAKFLFALRHPCDVVLSCYMQNFRVTRAMASFLSLENAARLYAATMTHWQQARRVMPLNVHTIRYEDLVQDFEGQIRAVIEFLGLKWTDSLLDYQTTAVERGYIRTPSYSQVTEKVYTRSSGRWLKYRAHLEPILPILSPWIEQFGYEPL